MADATLIRELPAQVRSQIWPSLLAGAVSPMQVEPAGQVLPHATADAHLPFTQELDRQSLSRPQAAPSAHPGEQAGEAHLPFEHTPDPQSALAPQTWPVPQVGAHAGDAQ